MATTDLDGTNLMLLREGTQVTMVLGDRSYLGTLRMRKDGIEERWYIALNEGGKHARALTLDGEIGIHKRPGAVEITERA